MKEEQIDFSVMQSAPLVILDELKSISSGLSSELSKYLLAGGSLMVVPSPEADIASYNNFLSAVVSSRLLPFDTTDTKVSRLDADHPLFDGVFEKRPAPGGLDLPKVFGYFPIRSSARATGRSVLDLQSGTSFLERHDAGKGFLYLSGTSFRTSYSNFARHALFVPVMYRIAMLSMRQSPVFYFSGTDRRVELSSEIPGEPVLQLTDPKGKELMVASYSNVAGRPVADLHDVRIDAGNFEIRTGKQTLAPAAFNYARAESDLDVIDAAGLQERIANAGLGNWNVLEAEEGSVTRMLEISEHGIRLWKWCLALALLFIAVEVILLRLLK